MKKEIFADIKKYGWPQTRSTHTTPTGKARRHKRSQAGTVPLPWEAGINYRVNIVVTYSGSSYTCITAHLSEVGHTPDTLPLLWQVQP